MFLTPRLVPGGMIAQSLVLAAPHLVDRLVLGCTHYGGHELEPPSDGFLACFNPLDFKELGPFKCTSVVTCAGCCCSNGGVMLRRHRSHVGVQLHTRMGSGAQRAVPLRCQSYICHQAPLPLHIETDGWFVAVECCVVLCVGGLNHVLWIPAIADYDVSDRVGSITSPTLVLHGTHDEVVPFANGKKLAAAIPGAALKCLDRCGHIFWDMDSRQSVRAVETFLSAACAELPRSRPTHARSKL